MSDVPGDRIDVHIGGDVSGQFVAGRHNTTISSRTPDPVTAADLSDLTAMFDRLRHLVAGQAGDQARAGFAKIDELEEAITAAEPDLATMEHVQGWFSRKLATLADPVRSIIVNPIVARLVAGAGDALAADFRRRFGL